MHPQLRELERQNDLLPSRLERIEEDYQVMKYWLPVAAADILDIGCGHPQIDIFIARHYGGNVTVHLMDGDEEIQPISKEHVNFRPSTVAWKNRHKAVEALRGAVPSCAVVGHSPDPWLTIPCDLIVSTRAWGHHFPIYTYLDLADRSLRPNGRIIVDIRIGTKGLHTLERRGFRVISENLETKSIKCQRWVLSR